MAQHDILLNHHVVSAAGIKIGDNPGQMFDAVLDPIAHTLRIDHSFVSLEFYRDPANVLNEKFMRETDSINGNNQNKKFGASRHFVNAVHRIFGNQIYFTQLSEEYELPLITVSYKMDFDSTCDAGTEEFKNLQVFVTPTTGTPDDSVGFKEANGLRWSMMRENERQKPVKYNNDTVSKLKLINRFYKSQGVDTANATKLFEQTTKGASILTHEIMREVAFANDVRAIAQFDRNALRNFRQNQLALGQELPPEIRFKKQSKFCPTDHAAALIGGDNILRQSDFDISLFVANKGTAIFNTAALRHYLLTDKNESFTTRQCERLAEIQQFQDNEGIRPVYLKSAGPRLRVVKNAAA